MLTMKSSLNSVPRRLVIAFGVIFAIALGCFIYLFIRVSMMNRDIAELNSNINSLAENLASTTEELKIAIRDTHTSLSDALSTEKQRVGNITEQLGSVQSQVGNVAGTLSNLQKLSKTDRELLKKYSKVYFLNDNYVPARLSEVPLALQYSETKQTLVHSDVLPRLESVIKAASAAGIKIYVSSAYRSFDEQRALKSDYRVTYGAGTANSFSADQGYSEHQLGTAIDFISTGQGGSIDGFENTEAYKWMLANAWKYGFVLSYPENNDYYVFEPWHWRFVGIKLAADLHDQRKSFYDLDQRKIDEYLVTIFD